MDLEYLQEDLPKLIDSMQLGVARIRTISISLRIFSHSDSDRPVLFNIHQGINSTILILKHRLQSNDTRPAIAHSIVVDKHFGTLEVNSNIGQGTEFVITIFIQAATI